MKNINIFITISLILGIGIFVFWGDTFPHLKESTKDLPTIQRIIIQVDHIINKLKGINNPKQKGINNPKQKGINSPKQDEEINNVTDEQWEERFKGLIAKETSLDEILKKASNNREIESLKKYCVAVLSVLSIKNKVEDKHLQYIRVYVLLRLLKANNILIKDNISYIKWLVDTDFIKHLIMLSKEEDDLVKSFEIVYTLYHYKPELANKYKDLIIAFALVWDQELRPLHNDVDKTILPSKLDIKEYYKYYGSLFNNKKETSAIPYKNLTVKELMIIIDTPVPVEELQWGFKHKLVKFSDWRNYYTKISYNKKRYEDISFFWKGMPYSLANINKYGGLETDIIYATTIISRSYGIPTIFFLGTSSRGSHAWYAYKNSAGQWKANVNRYKYDTYADGVAIDPQTRQPMTKNNLRQLIGSTLKKKEILSKNENDFISISLRDVNPALASLYTKNSLKDDSKDENTWKRLENILLKNSLVDDYYIVVENKLEVFKEFKDIYYNAVSDLRLQYRKGNKFENALKMNSILIQMGEEDKKYKFIYKFDFYKNLYLEGKLTKAQNGMQFLLKKYWEHEEVRDLFIKYLQLSHQYKQDKLAFNFSQKMYKMLDQSSFSAYFMEAAKANRNK